MQVEVEVVNTHTRTPLAMLVGPVVVVVEAQVQRPEQVLLVQTILVLAVAAVVIMEPPAVMVEQES
jgi:hypothetical protein